MGKEYTLQEAVRFAMKAARDSLEFYRTAGALTTDGARRVFELLAGEKLACLKALLLNYQGGDLGDLDEVLRAPAQPFAAGHAGFEHALAADLQEEDALAIAMQEEKRQVERCTLLARDMVDPLVRRVFETVARDSQGHYDMIEEEYMRLMRMVDRSDQDIYVRE